MTIFDILNKIGGLCLFREQYEAFSRKHLISHEWGLSRQGLITGYSIGNTQYFGV